MKLALRFRLRSLAAVAVLLAGAFASTSICVTANAAEASRESASEADRTLSLIMSDSGFNTEVVPLLQAEVEKQGFILRWVVVNDIIQPNKLVDDGSAETNSFQHEPYFDQFVRDHRLKNVTRAFYTYFIPSGLYSRKYQSLADLPDGATIGIPVDPANNGRALFLLRDHGLLKIRDGVPVTRASVRDITANPRGFKFREVDQLMLLRTLDSVDVGFLFAANAILGGLDPIKDALAFEQVGDSPYKGIVAAHPSVLGTAKLDALRRAYHSDAIRAYFARRYGDAIIFLDYLNDGRGTGFPAWRHHIADRLRHHIADTFRGVLCLGRTLKEMSRGGCLCRRCWRGAARFGDVAVHTGSPGRPATSGGVAF